MSHKHNQLTFDELLRQRLKEWREGLDDVNSLFSENVVPQEERKFRNGWGCISNSDIENLIDQVPRSMNDPQAIPGIGPTKLNKYGDSLLAVIEKTTEERRSLQTFYGYHRKNYGRSCRVAVMIFTPSLVARIRRD